MDPEFEAAVIAIYTGEPAVLDQELTANPALVTNRSSCGHPTLLQLVACKEVDLVDPVGAARLLVGRGAETWFPVVSAAGCNSAAVLKLLIDRGATYDGEDVWTPLEEALYWASRDTIELLVEHHAPVRSLAAAAGLGDLEALEDFLDGDPLRADAGPIRSPFPDTVSDELANDPQPSSITRSSWPPTPANSTQPNSSTPLGPASTSDRPATTGKAHRSTPPAGGATP